MSSGTPCGTVSSHGGRGRRRGGRASVVPWGTRVNRTAWGPPGASCCPPRGGALPWRAEPRLSRLELGRGSVPSVLCRGRHRGECSTRLDATGVFYRPRSGECGIVTLVVTVRRRCPRTLEPGDELLHLNPSVRLSYPWLHEEHEPPADSTTKGGCNMTGQQPSPTRAASQEPLSYLRLRGHWQVLGRSAWITLGILSLGTFFATLPEQLVRLQTLCAGAACSNKQLTPEQAQLLSSMGWSLEGYATLLLALTLASGGLSLLVSTLIIWRRSDDRM